MVLLVMIPFLTLMVSLMNLATEASSKKAATITIVNWSFILTRKLEWNALFLLRSSIEHLYLGCHQMA